MLQHRKEKEDRVKRLKSYRAMSPTERDALVTKILTPGIVDFMYGKGYAPKYYNSNYGGRWFSQEAYRLMEFVRNHTSSPLIYLNKSQEDVVIPKNVMSERVRKAIIRAKVCLYLKNTEAPSNAFNFVKATLHKCFHCSEYDGKETVDFNRHEMQILETKRTLKKKKKTAEEKVQEIQNIVDNRLSEDQVMIDFETAVQMFTKTKRNERKLYKSIYLLFFVGFKFNIIR
jgi:tellurite resistance protein